MCSSCLGFVGNSTNCHCLMCNNTNTGYSSINLPSFACSKHIAKDESEESDESDGWDKIDEDDNSDNDDFTIKSKSSFTINFAERRIQLKKQ